MIEKPKKDEKTTFFRYFAYEGEGYIRNVEEKEFLELSKKFNSGPRRIVFTLGNAKIINLIEGDNDRDFRIFLKKHSNYRTPTEESLIKWTIMGVVISIISAIGVMYNLFNNNGISGSIEEIQSNIEIMNAKAEEKEIEEKIKKEKKEVYNVRNKKDELL